MNKEDLVSVIMPTYNAGKFLADSIKCILRQTYENLELIITDDASTDRDTIKILKEFAQADKRVKIELLSEPRSGICSKRMYQKSGRKIHSIL